LEENLYRTKRRDLHASKGDGEEGDFRAGEECREKDAEKEKKLSTLTVERITVSEGYTEEGNQKRAQHSS
jgi:hypothetical protein